MGRTRAPDVFVRSETSEDGTITQVTEQLTWEAAAGKPKAFTTFEVELPDPSH